ncbi:MAG: NAD(P)-dependent alcohol dehydrogenase [Terricaulis sp.]
MKAISLKAPASLDNLKLIDAPEPGAPGAGEIKVRVHASSLNFHDFAVVAGMIPSADGRIPMSDGAGDVVAVGAGVSEFKAGDKVVSTFFPEWHDGRPPDSAFRAVPGDGIDGFAREFVVAKTTAFTHVPKGYTHAEAATLTCAGLTAWRALVVEGQLKAGDVVLTQGCGGVSVFALQIAKAMGATVVSTSSSDEKLERMKALGADMLINYKKEPNWGAKARELTGGVDHVVEIGGAGTMPESINACHIGGHISLIGVLAGPAGPVPTVMIMGKQLRVIGITVGSRRQQLDFIRAIDATGIKPILDKSFPLDGIADAFRHQMSGAHFGKIVLEY